MCLIGCLASFSHSHINHISTLTNIIQALDPFLVSFSHSHINHIITLTPLSLRHFLTLPNHCCPGKMKIQTGSILLNLISRLIYPVRCLNKKQAPYAKSRLSFGCPVKFYPGFGERQINQRLLSYFFVTQGRKGFARAARESPSLRKSFSLFESTDYLGCPVKVSLTIGDL